MAPSIQIELDPGPSSDPGLADYHVCGGTISGHAVVSTDEPLNCRAVMLSVGWHTEGRGDEDEESVFEEWVHEGELSAGEHRFAFSARIPDGPMSYAGHYINVIWRVTAQIDLAWKRDPTAERTFFAVLP